MITLEDILSPITLDDFVSHFWGLKPLWIKGNSGKLLNLYSLENFKAIPHETWPETAVIRAVFGQSSQFDSSYISGREMNTAYESGATICVSWLDQADRKLLSLCNDTKLKTGFLGEIHINSYWSPDGAGLDAHFDARQVINIQIEGQKTWRYAERPTVPWPAGNARLTNINTVEYCDSSIDSWEQCNDIGLDLAWNEVTLQPGDVLCIPAGTFHEAKSIDNSFALSLHFNSLDTGKYIGKLISAVFLDREEWRHFPPIFSKHAYINDRALTYLNDRIDETIQLLSSWKNDPKSFLFCAAPILVSDLLTKDIETKKTYEDYLKEKEYYSTSHITSTTLLKKAPFLLSFSEEGSEEIICLVGIEKIYISGDTAKVIRCALNYDSFTAEDLDVKGLNPDGIFKIIESLVLARILVQADL